MNEDMHGAVEALLDEVGLQTEPKPLFDANSLTEGELEVLCRTG